MRVPPPRRTGGKQVRAKGVLTALVLPYRPVGLIHEEIGSVKSTTDKETDESHVTQAEKRERTRAALLRAAQSVFGRRGYHGATLDEIVDQAGLSKGALYYNFANKEELFLALLEARMDERLRDIESALAVERSPEAELERSALDYVHNLERNREWITLFFEFVAYAARDPAFGAQFSERFKRFWAALARLVEERARRHEIDLPLPAEHVAIALDATGIGFMIARIVDPDAAPDDLLGSTLSFMLRGMVDASRDVSR